jgi:hypothetical protein
MTKQHPHRTLAALRPRITSLPPRILPPTKKADAVYVKPEWRRLVARIITQRGRRCEKCGRFRDENGAPIRIFGDHIVELKDGGPVLDAGNVMLLCGSCHTAKSNCERAKRMARRYTRSLIDK